MTDCWQLCEASQCVSCALITSNFIDHIQWHSNVRSIQIIVYTEIMFNKKKQLRVGNITNNILEGQILILQCQKRFNQGSKPCVVLATNVIGTLFIHVLVMSSVYNSNATLHRLFETQLWKQFRSVAYRWNPQTSSHNTSFVQFSLAAGSSVNQSQASFTCQVVCRAVYHLFSVYLLSLVTAYTVYTPTRTLRWVRSANQGLLTIPEYHLEHYVCQAFFVAGPTLWNTLSPTILEANSVTAFNLSCNFRNNMLLT